MWLPLYIGETNAACPAPDIRDRLLQRRLRRGGAILAGAAGEDRGAVRGGGPADIYARAIAEKLQGALGQPFVVEDKPGGGSIVGTDFVAKSPPTATRSS
jgi:hypothetical protein